MSQSSARLIHGSLIRRYHVQLAGCSVLASILRLVHVHALHYSPMADMATYLNYWYALFHDGNANPFSTILFPPGYPFYLHLVSFLFPIAETIKPALYIQVFASAGGLLALAGVARYFYGVSVAVVSAFAYAIYRISILNTGVLLTESLYTDCFLLCLFVFTRLQRKPSGFTAIIAGILIAIATHLRTNGALLGLLLPICLLYDMNRVRPGAARRDGGLLRRIALPALIAVTAFGLMAPWSLRNSLLIGRPCFVGDNLGHNLIQGNNEVADGRWTPPEWLPERLYGKMNNLPAPQWHEAMKQHALQFMTSNPAQELFYLIPAKLRLLFVENQVFWPWEDRQPKGHFATNPFGPRFYFPLLPFIPVLVLGVAGLFYRGRHLPHFIPLIWICSVLPFIVLVPNVRYRSPSDPLLIIMASAVFVRLVPRAQFRRITRLLVLGIFWWALAGMTLQWARFSGANLLKTKSLLRRGEAAQQMIRGVYTGHFTGISRDNMVSEPVGIIAVNPARVSDLLVSFDYSIKMLEPAERWMTINFTINYDDETSATVTMPATIDTVVPAQAALNSFQERGGTAWRIIHVPALTRFIRFDFTSNMCSDVKISNLAVHGPSWGNNPHLPGTIADKSPERGRQ